MSAITLIVSSCVGRDSSTKIESYVATAKNVANFDENIDRVEVAFVAFGEGPNPADITTTETVVQDNSISALLLINHQITSIPCVLIVRKTDDPVLHEVLPLNEDLQSIDEGTADEHCDAAIAFYNEFNIHEAVTRFECALRIDPNNKKALFNLASIVHMLDYPTLAVGYITRLLLLDSEDSIAHSFLWALYSTGKCTAAAIQSYSLLASVGDLAATTKLATLTGTGSTASRGDPLYAERIYDNMAAQFESKLVDHLGYRGPWLMKDLLEGLINGVSGSTGAGDSSTCAVQLRPKGEWRVLDVGCGSGLCGKIFDDFVHTDTSNDATTYKAIPLSLVPCTSYGLMAGIDVSGKILEVARSTGKYDSTEKCDLVQALKALDVTMDSSSAPGNTSAAEKTHVRMGLDMVIAADTFIYVGELGEVFARVRNALRDSAKESADGVTGYGGLFVFSTEDLEASPMRIDTHASGDSADIATAMVNALAVLGWELPGAVPGWGGQLLKSARFAHSDAYIRTLCDRYSFRVVVHEKIVLRTEETIPLPGNIYILQKIALPSIGGLLLDDEERVNSV